MAEFSEVMKQLARMANACKGECEKCPLDNSVLCTGPWCFGGTEGIAEAERIVMQWAEAHPEPVYPTWGEFFVKHGGLAERWENATNPAWEANMAIGMFRAPIPADIAEKLGIEPKEG